MFAKTIQPVANAQNGVPPRHPWPSVPHHRSDLFAPGSLIAMHGTIGARGFFNAEPAAIQTQSCVVQEVLARDAEDGTRAVVSAAVARYHRGNRTPFPRQSLVGSDTRPHLLPGARITFCRSRFHIGLLTGKHIGDVLSHLSRQPRAKPLLRLRKRSPRYACARRSSACARVFKG